ncbi:MAG: penicillin-binding protein activator, partial [Colwellia sp.]|nr:penicillin-binding protein activator [Colwellia sp.]
NDNASIYRLLVVKATSLQALHYSEQAYQQLLLAQELVTRTSAQQTPLTFTWLYYQTLSEVLLAKSQVAASTSALLFAFSMNEAEPNKAEQDAWQLWQQLSTLSLWQLQQVEKSQPPAFNGWKKLADYSHHFGAKPAQFSYYLSQWQQEYPTHPAHLIIDQLTIANTNLSIERESIKNIAVLLPLNGAQANAGIAAQQGLLSAYQNNTRVNLYFINTNQLDWSNLATRFTDDKIDHIIGPLLKTHVDKFITLSTEQTEFQTPTLLLNLPQHQTLANYQVALSMRPEDEAQQAAAVLSQQNYQSPLILSHQDKSSKRIALAFSKQWQIETGKAADIVYFNQGKKMQTRLKESLGVNSSQARINQLTSRLQQTIKTETRNRRDIDMIYLIGSAAQTRLIKPYIDVNISPFAKVIPVYASSKSHSHFNDINNKNSLNDLQHLTFTQMPWLLTSAQQNKQLAQRSQQIWPKRTDSLSRLFAMGFDSYNLLEKVPLMQQAPYIFHYGQTGTLKLNKNNVLTRSLIWGQYKNDSVTEIVLN